MQISSTMPPELRRHVHRLRAELDSAHAELARERAGAASEVHACLRVASNLAAAAGQLRQLVCELGEEKAALTGAFGRVQAAALHG